MLKHRILALALALLVLPATVSAADWTPLLTDDELSQWQGAGGGDSFRAKGGTLTVDGAGQIVYAGPGKPLDLTHFELRAEVLTRPGGRAGLAFHVPPGNPRSSGGLEVRLDNSYSRGPGQALLKTGSLVWLRPVVKSVVPDGRWFSVHVTVRGRRVQVRVDKQLLLDYHEPDRGDTGPRLKHGTVAIRGHGGSGAVLIRKLQVRLLTEGPAAAPVKLNETDAQLARLREQGFAVVDFHTHLKGSLTLDDVLARTWRTGIGAGVAVNCGKGFPIADDKGAVAFLERMRGKPVFVGMQAEGREWTRLFSPATVARFDYVFTDAMTITDHRGRRTRLWVKAEVDIPDPQAFMDRLVKAIETILEREPIDFYANPTYLPEVLAKDYDRLWTPARQRRVVAALARHGVALEINATLRLPRPPLIKMAKEAGVKFTFGTNNADRTLGRLDYCLRMVEECALTPDDLWAPKPDGQKPIQVRKRKGRAPG
jgi:hypothetical protein